MLINTLVHNYILVSSFNIFVQKFFVTCACRNELYRYLHEPPCPPGPLAPFGPLGPIEPPGPAVKN